MNKISLLCMNVAFFAASRVSGLASIVTAIKFSKFLQGLSSPCEISRGGGGGSSPPAPPYSTPMDVVTKLMKL